jgi:hypothetical protein
MKITPPTSNEREGFIFHIKLQHHHIMSTLKCMVWHVGTWEHGLGCRSVNSFSTYDLQLFKKQ